MSEVIAQLGSPLLLGPCIGEASDRLCGFSSACCTRGPDARLEPAGQDAEAIDVARTQGARLTLFTVAAPVRTVAGPHSVPVSEADQVRAAEQIAEADEALVPKGYRSRRAQSQVMPAWSC